MKKLVLNMPDELIEKMDASVRKWGFSSRTEFMRFAAIDFIRNDGRMLPADDVMRQHTKAILYPLLHVRPLPSAACRPAG